MCADLYMCTYCTIKSRNMLTKERNFNWLINIFFISISSLGQNFLTFFYLPLCFKTSRTENVFFPQSVTLRLSKFGDTDPPQHLVFVHVLKSQDFILMNNQLKLTCTIREMIHYLCINCLNHLICLTFSFTCTPTWAEPSQRLPKNSQTTPRSFLDQ